MKINVIILLSLILTTTGCSMSLTEDMTRTASDPVITAPSVSSFIDANTVYVSWARDDNADSYALYRALDDDGIFSLVYRGTDLSYKDRDVLSETRYLYLLYKIRGEKSFGPSPAAMGVGSSTIRDAYEPNDGYESATVFQYDLHSNLFGYKSRDSGITLLDRDYYCVTVKPHMTASYTVGVSGIADDASTGLNIQRKYYPAEDITNYNEIAFDNPSSSTVSFYFAIYIDENDIPIGGGHLVGYDLEYIGEVPSGT